MSWIKSKYRKINPETVGKDFDSIISNIQSHESRSMHGQLPIIWDRAKDFQVWDVYGNKFIDFSSTIFVSNAGHGNKHIIRSIIKTLKKPLFHAYNYPTRIRSDYLKYLITTLRERCGLWVQKAFLMSSGSEATECAIKLMRMYGEENPFSNKSRKIIISFCGNWHGRTMGAQMLSSNQKQKKWIGYEDPNIVHLPFPYQWENVENDGEKCFKKYLDKSKINQSEIVGFMLESYQGWSCAFYHKTFVRAIKNYCIDNDCILTFDEIQSGFGRTGKLFAYQHYNVEPNLICCGKGCSSGFPLSMVIGEKKLLDLPDVGSMSSTHSANPLACASGMANLKFMIDSNLIRKSEILGHFFQGELRRMQSSDPHRIKRVEGKGMVAALYFRDEKLATEISHKCMKLGLIVVCTGKETIKVAPPLTITKDALEDGLKTLEYATYAC